MISEKAQCIVGVNSLLKKVARRGAWLLFDGGWGFNFR